MSWHCLPELAEDYSRHDSLGGKRLPLVNRMSMPEGSCLGASETVISPDFPSGTTFEPLEVDPGVVVSMSCPVGSLAKISRARANAEASPDPSPGCGRSTAGSSRGFDLITYLRRTPPTSSTVVSIPFSVTWPSWGSMRLGVCSVQNHLEPPIADAGCGLSLPTPTTRGNEHSPSMRKWPAHRRLAELVSRIGGAPDREWMMGLPIGWTALEPLATPRFQQWQRQHFAYYKEGHNNGSERIQ